MVNACLINESQRISLIKTRPALKKPVVVFDMCFLDLLRDPVNSPRYPAVTGAARVLAYALRQAGAATPVFMSKSLMRGEAVDFPPGIETVSRPLFFCVSLYDDLFRATQREVALIKQKYPQAKILIGGPSVNTCKSIKALAAHFPEATALVKGDGEKVIVPLVRGLAGRSFDWQALRAVPGIFVKGEGRELWTGGISKLTQEEYKDGTEETIAYPELVKDAKRKRDLYLHTQLGCKWLCVFCSHNVHNRPIYWSAERIVQELRRVKTMIERGELPAEARRVQFMDNDFFQDQARALQFLSLVATDRELRGFFSFLFHSTVSSFFVKKGALNEALLDRLTELTVRDVFFGTDGFAGESLKFLRKAGGSYDVPMIFQLMEAFFQRGIHSTHTVIAGYPNIDLDTFIETFTNIHEAMIRFGKYVAFEITPGLCAFESNRLMEVAAELDKLEIVKIPLAVSSDGSEKRLSVQFPTLTATRADSPLWAVYDKIGELFDEPFPVTLREIKDLAKQARKSGSYDKQRRKTFKYLIRLWQREQPERLTLLKAILSHQQFIARFALEEALAGLAELKQATSVG